MRIDHGIVGSGDAWRQSPAVIHDVHDKTGSLCEEMEAHAVAQVADRFEVPFVASEVAKVVQGLRGLQAHVGGELPPVAVSCWGAGGFSGSQAAFGPSRRAS